MRLVNAIISLVKDANPKIVLMALESVHIFINDYKDIFHSSLNMTFDILLPKFGDSKVWHDIWGLEWSGSCHILHFPILYYVTL